MTVVTSKLKYEFADTSGVVSKQLFKQKAPFKELLTWRYVDKLNKHH